jgi:DNA-binding response OmpR family regulator
LVGSADPGLRGVLHAALTEAGYAAIVVATLVQARTYLQVTTDTHVAVLDDRLGCASSDADSMNPMHTEEARGLSLVCEAEHDVLLRRHAYILLSEVDAGQLDADDLRLLNALHVAYIAKPFEQHLLLRAIAAAAVRVEYQ